MITLFMPVGKFLRSWSRHSTYWAIPTPDWYIALFAGCPKSSMKSFKLIQIAAMRVLKGAKWREHISPILACLHISICLHIWYSYITLLRHFTVRQLVDLWFLEFLKVKWEVLPSAINLLPGGTSSQFWMKR